MEALDLHVEDRGRVEHDAGRLLDVGGETVLVGPLGLLHALEEGRVVLERDELLELHGVIEPPVTDGVGNETRVCGIGLGEEPTMRDAVGLVVEHLGIELVELVEHGLLENRGVQRGDAVHGVAEDDGEVRHADLAVPEDRGLGEHLLPVVEGLRELLAEAAVDFLYEHVESRHEGAEGVDGPLLERLGHDRVVGVRDGLLADLEREVEVDVLLVNEKTHELGTAHGGVGVVGVDAHVVAQVLPVLAVLALVVAQNRLKAGRDEQVLLLESQDAAVLARVVRVEDRRDGLDVGAELVGLGVVAGVEGVEVEVLGVGLGAPEAERVHGLAAVADDGHVIRDGADEVPALLGEPEAAGAVLVAHDLPAELHDHGARVLAHLPGEAVGEPVVGLLDLAAALDALTEEAVAVAHAVAVAVDALVRHGVEEAGGQSSEAAVAEAGVNLLAADDINVGAHVGERIGDDVAAAEVEQVVIEQRAEKELEGEVVDLLLAIVGGIRGDVARPAGDELGQHGVTLLVGEILELLADLRHAHLAVLSLEFLLVLEDAHNSPMF